MSLLPNEFPNLSTSRLLLRKIVSADNTAVYSLFSDPAVMQYHNLEPFTILEQADAFIQRVTDRFSRGEGVRWGITQPEQGTVIGTCGFTSITSSNHTGRIGYDLQQAFWHQGIMSEALASILTYGFTVLRLHRIEALVMLANGASSELLRRLGFNEEGILRDYDYWKGNYWSLRCFSLIAPEWQWL
jgi:[ribosomal protein S5]-alanine N-acetyltransferase